MSCTNCGTNLKLNNYRQTKFQILVCGNNCYNWFKGDTHCLRDWIEKQSGLSEVKAQGKNEMTNEDFLAIDFTNIKKYTDFDCPIEGCDAKIVAMKTLMNVDGQRRRYYQRFSDSTELYDMYYRESGQWKQTWKRYVNDRIKDLKKELSWMCFDNTKTYRIQGGNQWWNRTRHVTDRQEFKRIDSYSRSYYYRQRLTDEQKEKHKEITAKRRFALVLMQSPPDTDITTLPDYEGIMKFQNPEENEEQMATIPTIPVVS